MTGARTRAFGTPPKRKDRVPGRAYTTQEKRAVLDKLFRAWCLVPGKTLDEVIWYSNLERPVERPLPFSEDEELGERVLAWAKREAGLTKETP